MGITIVYLLIIGGAIIMAMPFAWMVVTSFKSSSEIAQWPPRWTSKNFKSEIMVNVKGTSSSGSSKSGLSLAEFRAAQSEDTYNPYKKLLIIEDDPVRRGLITLTFSKLDYADNQELNSLVEKIKEYNANYPLVPDLSAEINTLDNSPESFEKFYFSLYSTANGLFKKSQLLKYLDKEIKDSINYIDKFTKVSLDRLPYLKVKSTDSSVVKEEKARKKEELKEYLFSLKTELSNVSSVVVEMSKGTGIVSDNEINKVLALLTNLESKFVSFNDMYLRRVNRLLEKNIYSSIINSKNSLEFKVFFEKNYSDIQKKAAKINIIQFNVPTKEDMKENFLKAFHNSNIPEEFKKALNENDDIFEIKDEFVLALEHKFNEHTLNILKIKSEDLSRTLMVIRNLTKYIDKLQPDNVEQYLNPFDKEFVKNQNFKAEDLIKLAKMRKDYNNILETFNKLYSDSISEVKLIQKPENVEKVYYRNYSNIEIYFKDTYAIWFLEDNPTMKAKFTPSQVFANVFQNYVDAWHAAPFSKYYINTVFMATTTTIFEILIAAMAAFAFAKLEFWGKNALFTLFLATMMVPGEVMLVPNFITISKFRWLDTYYALIIPWIVSVFAIFLLRQQFLTIPNDLWDAAKIDGSSSWRFLWTVMVPLSKPAIITGALLKFVGSWNAFLWVLIVTKSPEMRTLAVGLQTFTTESGTMYNLLMAASTFSVIPIIILFIFMQKYFVAGIARSGLKG
ncbi:hypothetical protein XO10_05385 [Marinitoga sp. 1135]|nr:hypothetical protein LN42_05940 [Marinitoga sp. 1137]NUU95795.1 hypothetical protein [Marinitoga sp. 1135]NUU97713.1 hypothetical protein [Marinitoga sp. 1138]